VVEHSLDMLCPKQSDGMRVKFGGETLDKGFFHRLFLSNAFVFRPSSTLRVTTIPLCST
jgi:hypothetical protein